MAALDALLLKPALGPYGLLGPVLG